MGWVILVIALLVVGGIVAGTSPTRRYWEDARPGRPGSADPTGNIPEPDAEFRRPSDEGDLL